MPLKPAMKDSRSIWLRTIAFVVGFCIMTIELVSGRVIAPYLGSSLYTWTAVLTSVLAGIAIGSYLGGKLSESRPPWSSVGTWLLASALMLVATIFLFASGIGPWLRESDWSIALLTMLFSFFVFFPPALLLSFILPLLVKGDVSTVQESGAKFGSLAAWNAAGSILGTYAAGFFFIAYLNTNIIIVSVIAVLMMAAASERLIFRKTPV